VDNQIYTNLEINQIKLQDRDLVKIVQLLDKNKRRKEYLVSILQDIDAEYGYLPDFILKFISQELDVPLSQIYNIATFYTAFSLVRKGKFKITACLGTACHVRGAQRIMDRLERELGIKSGETTGDLQFSLEAVRCLGCCGLAPVVTVNEDLYGKMSQARVPKIIEKYSKEE
jgi:NADH:ubiquinone oxidoreductase subunit E